MNPTIFVGGFGRCGSSLVMQMLNATGIRCLGRYPSFEDYDFSRRMLRGETVDHLPPNAAIKWLDPQRAKKPQAGEWVLIWMHRDPIEQAKSAVKMMQTFGQLGSVGRQARKALAGSYRKDLPAARSRFQHKPHLELAFEDLIRYPGLTALRIAEFLARWYGEERLDVEKMAGAVITREPACLPYMLEIEQVARSAGLGPELSSPPNRAT